MSDKNRLSKEMLDDLDSSENKIEKTLPKQGRGNIQVNKARVEYMAQPNVKEFNNAVRKHSFGVGGRPVAFESVESLTKELTDYFDLCDKTNTVPTIVGIALYLGVHRDTIYAHANNSNSPYSDILQKVITYCHMTMENGAIAGKINPVTYIFLGKNYFNLSDSKDINIIPSSDPTITNNQATMDALQKQLAEENVPNATFIESSND